MKPALASAASKRNQYLIDGEFPLTKEDFQQNRGHRPRRRRH